MENEICSICGNNNFRESSVLWPELIREWQLSDQERSYIDKQQGKSCISCGANLRVIALGNAILSAFGCRSTLRSAVDREAFANLRILDCNGAEGISAALSSLSGYQRADYPEYDMRMLPFANGSFDLVIHSDTLEHIRHPILALQECRRILAQGGKLCFTVPIIVGRMTRDRAGLTPSFHGDPLAALPDLMVHTEFGVDAWTIVHRAGFSSLALHSVDFPSAIAITAWSEEPLVISSGEASAHQEETDVDVMHSNKEQEQEQEHINTDIENKIYDQDGLRSIHNHEFMADPIFQAAYARGVKASGADYQWHWRVHTGLWAARMAFHLPGDFAEFGVNKGFMSSAIMETLNWNHANRKFYLLDTFSGIDERYVNDDDRAIGVIERNRRDIDSGFYTFDLDAVRANYSEWPNAVIIAGPVPDTLELIDSNNFAFAHIDMNCAPPEAAAAEFIWSRLVPGGIVLLDDYAYAGYRSQKLAMDAFARSKSVQILSLPTGQGLMIKPAG